MSRFFSVALLVALALPVGAQPVHLPPPYDRQTEYDAPLLLLALADSGFAGTTLTVRDGTLIVTPPGQSGYRFETADRTTDDLAREIRDHYRPQSVDAVGAQGSFLVSAPDGSLPARYLAETVSPVPVTESGTATLRTRRPQPTVDVGVGVLLSMGDRDPGSSDGVLNQTGFQLDVAGTHQIVRTTGAMGSPQVYLSGRIAVAADQELVSKNVALDGSTTQVNDALQKADQITLGMQSDVVWDLWSPNQQIALYTEIGINYTRLDQVDEPETIRSGLEMVPFESAFTEAALTRARLEANRTVPLLSLGAGAMFRFAGRDGLAFYSGGGIQWQENTTQGLQFTRDAASVPNPESLTGDVGTPLAFHWRAVLGVRVAGIVDLRADALSPITRTDGSPILRLFVARTFRLTQ